MRNRNTIIIALLILLLAALPALSGCCAASQTIPEEAAPAATEAVITVEVQTQAPEASAQPITTEAPEATAQPVTTEAPAATEQPKSTEKPAATEQPKATEQPASGSTVDPKAALGSFKTQDIYGKSVSASIWEGKTLTMVNVWATYCGYCINEMPELGELSGEYASKGVQLLGIVMDVYNSDGTLNQDQVTLAQQIAEKTGADYTHLIPTSEIYQAALTSVRGYPTSFFVDGQGNIVGDYYAGARSKSQFKSLIDDMLSKVG